MKKRLLTLSLVSLMSATFLGSCASDPYTWKEGVLITVNGKDIKVDDIYGEYNNNIDGAKAYYEAINNILVWLVQPTTAAMESEVQAKIDDFNQTVSDNAKTNGTSEKEEREALLASNGFETMEQLRNSYVLEQKQKANENAFYDDDTYLGEKDANGDRKYDGLIHKFIEEYHPYHVRHILVKVDASSDQIVDGKISEDDAKQLANVYSRLTSGEETFGEVARAASDDTSSAANFGDTGIMSTSTSFVNEFKYSLYAYDAYFNEKTSSERAAVKSALNIPDDADSVIGDGLFGIPSYVFEELETYADVTKNKDKNSVDNASEVNYPRNILFNKYLNNHGTSLIYYSPKDGNIDENNIPHGFVKMSNVKLKSFTNSGSDGLGQTSLSEVETSDKYILCDENQNPILVTRAGTGSGDSGYQGIHFIIAQRSPFVDTDTLDYYYNLDIPSTTDRDPDLEPTYINFIKTDNRKTYTDRATEIKDASKNVFSNINFEIYRSNLAKAVSEYNVTIPANINNLIEKYISSVEESSKTTANETYENNWTSYIDMLGVQRDLVGRILPEGCIDVFYNGDGSIEKGTTCYVK